MAASGYRPPAPAARPARLRSFGPRTFAMNRRPLIRSERRVAPSTVVVVVIFAMRERRDPWGSVCIASRHAACSGGDEQGVRVADGPGMSLGQQVVARPFGV